jgi:tetratricopeptide (TPR) repeat protein
MTTPRKTYFFFSLLCLGGIVCVAFALQQHRYARFISVGNQAVAEKRFDTQEYVRASRSWFARRDKLLFNQGVLAYRAGNVPGAADYFQRASQHTQSVTLRTQTLYNLSVALLAEQEAEGAAELLKETLRQTHVGASLSPRTASTREAWRSCPSAGAWTESRARGEIT